MEIPRSNSKLVFNSKKHEYLFKGKQIPSTTWVLRAEGIIDVQYFTDYDATRGSAIHKACELIAKGTIDWRTVDDRILPYIEAYQKFLQETNFEPKIIEQPYVHETLEYGTKPDQIGFFKETQDDPIIVELKTGKIFAWTRIQTASQTMAVFPENYYNVKRLAVELRDDGNWRSEWHNDPDDFGGWCTLLGATVWKLSNGFLTLEQN